MSKRKIDYSLKAEAIRQGYDKIERTISKTKYKYYQACINECQNGEVISEELQQQYKDACLKAQNLANNGLYIEAGKINHASYQRRNRLEKRISQMLSSSTCIFVTLTFKNEVLDNTTQETRKKYVIRALKKMSDSYVANIDFGTKNQREHYHAIVVSESVNRDYWKDYGAINFLKIEQTSDSVKLAKYIVKLTNHAMKETVQQNRVIYSKN